jgi:hypothetical protein
MSKQTKAILLADAAPDLLEALKRLLNFNSAECLCDSMRAEDCLDEGEVCPICDAWVAVTKAERT